LPDVFLFDIRDLSATVTITSSSNPLAAPALSMRRLKISCASNGFILVSPRDEMVFLEDTCRAAPEAKIDLWYLAKTITGNLFAFFSGVFHVCF